MPKTKTFDELIPVQLKLERYQADALKKRAREEKISMSALIRKYIEDTIIGQAGVSADHRRRDSC